MARRPVVAAQRGLVTGSATHGTAGRRQGGEQSLHCMRRQDCTHCISLWPPAAAQQGTWRREKAGDWVLLQCGPMYTAAAPRQLPRREGKPRRSFSPVPRRGRNAARFRERSSQDPVKVQSSSNSLKFQSNSNYDPAKIQPGMKWRRNFGRCIFSSVALQLHSVPFPRSPSLFKVCCATPQYRRGTPGRRGACTVLGEAGKKRRGRQRHPTGQGENVAVVATAASQCARGCAVLFLYISCQTAERAAKEERADGERRARQRAQRRKKTSMWRRSLGPSRRDVSRRTGAACTAAACGRRSTALCHAPLPCAMETEKQGASLFCCVLLFPRCCSPSRSRLELSVVRFGATPLASAVSSHCL